MPTVRCPTCARKSEYDKDNVSRPFCSERCKMIDLGAWASDQYSVAGDPATDLALDQALPVASEPRD